MKAASGLHLFETDWNGKAVQAAYACPNCHRISIATETTADDPFSRNDMQRREVAQIYEWGPYVSWLPKLGEEREFPDVPEHISSAATEATLCLSMGAHRAAGALARAVVEATAKDKASGGSNLFERIEALFAAGHIRAHTKEQAHEIRHFGNEMAHGEFAEEISEEEATEIIELMAEVLNEVYQSPARLAKVRETRELRKSQNGD